MRREAPEPWATAMRERGMLHGQRPSFSQLAAAARPHTQAGTLTPQAVIDIVTGKTQEPADEIVRALALALVVPVEEVARWIGRPLEVGTAYRPPEGADRLSRKQREALDHIIRVMVDREAGEDRGNAAPNTETGQTPAPPETELAEARAAGEADARDSVFAIVNRGPLAQPRHFPREELHAAYLEGWQSVKGADVEKLVDAMSAASERHTPRASPTKDQLAELRRRQESADEETVEHITQQAAETVDKGDAQ